MPYKFNFDLSQFSQSFFREIAKFSEKRGIHRKMGEKARYLVEKFKVHTLVGLPLSDALLIIEDLMDTYIKNLSQREDFIKTRKRALLLPHCARKYMDNRCKAKFNQKTCSYECAHCSPDCKINRASVIGKERGYDVYILPGGSCIKRIASRYEGVVGVACCEEIKLGEEHLKELGISAQAVPLIKNGCSQTIFNFESLEKIL
jgi:hypothetical protein